MLKKTITYTDFDGNERTEDFYFNLTKAEIWERNLAAVDKDHPNRDYATLLQSIVESKNGKEIMNVFKSLILDSYGEKSEDGKRFIKSPELTQNFASTEAYSELFVELCTNADSAAAFVKGILPKLDKEEAVS